MFYKKIYIELTMKIKNWHASKKYIIRKLIQLIYELIICVKIPHIVRYLVLFYFYCIHIAYIISYVHTHTYMYKNI